MGGPNICPPCDCGIPPKQVKLERENSTLRERLKIAEKLAEAVRRHVEHPSLNTDRELTKVYREYEEDLCQALTAWKEGKG